MGIVYHASLLEIIIAIALIILVKKLPTFLESRQKGTTPPFAVPPPPSAEEEAIKREIAEKIRQRTQPQQPTYKNIREQIPIKKEAIEQEIVKEQLTPFQNVSLQPTLFMEEEYEQYLQDLKRQETNTQNTRSAIHPTSVSQSIHSHKFLKTRKQLRSAILYSEILKKPLSIR
ncbi:MAG: hypothetical protein A2007_02565 [Verrucomicrobia bacterium GWC2_42_7]|nr:MAG: hypothetical protein A2007_02565 [Verrucomicrobia bacterium GWC2_42_7]